MHRILLILAAFTLLGYLLLAIEALRGRRLVPRLPSKFDGGLPSAAIVVAARNEAHHIEHGLQTHLAQTYPDLEVIAVDDRSDDGTPAVLARMAERNPRLKVIRIDQLPEGWLGKTHALHMGAAAATADWILFTDADVKLEPSALARAVTLAESCGADHLALGPTILGGSMPFRMFMTAFAFSFSLLTRSWRVSNPRAQEAIGIGAFNLIRRQALQSVDGLTRIALRPDDDLMLARLLKRSGFRNVFARSGGAVAVQWYPTLREAARGLEKNAFATLEYSLLRLLGASLGMLVFAVWPFAALFATADLTFALNAASAAMMMFATGAVLRESGISPVFVITLPCALLLFLAIVWRASLLNLAQGGVVWRGTKYPLDQLKRNRLA